MSGTNHLFKISGDGVDREPVDTISIDPFNGIVYANRPIDREAYPKPFHVSHFPLPNSQWHTYFKVMTQGPFSTDQVRHPWQVYRWTTGQGTGIWCRSERHQWQRTTVCCTDNDVRLEWKCTRRWVSFAIIMLWTTITSLTHYTNSETNKWLYLTELLYQDVK